MSRAVCRNCWTWYIKGETVCPHCHMPLTVADAGAPPVTAGGPLPDPALPSTPQPFPALGASGTRQPNWTLLLPAGILAIVAVIAIGVLISLNLGGPAVASDGHFSVKAPRGWVPTTTSFVAGRRVVLALARRSSGERSEFDVADFGQLVPLADIQNHWGEVAAQMQAHLGTLTSTTIGGTPALRVDIETPQSSGQLLFVNYGTTTYIVALAAPPSQFEQMRSGDFAAILSSWQWR
ncbi:MAG TPA: hypothetical protein VHK65_12950 [Candidatus Dormibacteraeota bacterium]|nr:hypothetical protein [Candidatus Dormibacteraeota bacterium]